MCQNPSFISTTVGCCFSVKSPCLVLQLLFVMNPHLCNSVVSNEYLIDVTLTTFLTSTLQLKILTQYPSY